VRVALVTGGGRGLGRTHALALAAQGTAVVIADTGAELDGRGGDPDVAAAVADEIAASGGRALACNADVATSEGAGVAVGLALECFGRLDAVVNNAGILRDKSFGKLVLEDFDAVVRGHLGASACCTHAAWDALRASGSGRVVLTTSASGLFGNFGQAAYAAAKAGMVGLMRVLKLEGERHGIRVNAVAPVAATRMTAPLMASDALARLAPELVSPVVAYLASEACAHSGLILQAGAGRVSRVRIVESAPAELDGDIAELIAALEPDGERESVADSLAHLMKGAPDAAAVRR
jgi:NAD(P)-dependent dehydrogenase (short-subunit alcohol dehydrogenase family)